MRTAPPNADYSDEESRTLGEEVDAWLARWKATRSQSRRTVEFYERAAMFWDCVRDAPVSTLRRAVVEDLVAERAAEHPRSAKNELAFLKRVLRDARSRGQRIDESVLTIDPVRAPPRRGRALTVTQLYEFASWFPDHSKRLILLAGMIGARQRVWFGLTEDSLDLEEGIMEIPPELSKNARAHRVFLTPLEIDLFREQVRVRARGTRLLFSTPEAKPWTANRFRDRLWIRCLSRAIEHGASRDTDVLRGFTFHHLRHTACSLMAAAGMDPAVAAERAGHSDGGALFLRTYRHLYESEKRSQALRLEAKIIAELDARAKDKPAETQLIETLHEQLAAWQEAQAVRAYLVELERRYPDSATTAEWARWIRGHLETLDRLQRAPAMPALGPAGTEFRARSSRAPDEGRPHFE